MSAPAHAVAQKPAQGRVDASAAPAQTSPEKQGIAKEHGRGPSFDFGRVQVLPPAPDNRPPPPPAPPPPPPRPPVRAPRDVRALEEEADALADEVAQGRPAHAPAPPAAGAPPDSPDTPPAPSPGGAASAGHRLPPSIRDRLERSFGASFADVRVHADPAAAAEVASLGAIAFARGPHLAFARGQYEPHTREGFHLIAHELAHVVQQRRLGAAFLGRHDPPMLTRIPVRTEVLREGLEIRYGTGWCEIYVGARRWAVFDWDAAAHPGEISPLVALRENSADGVHDLGLGIRLEADFPVHAFIDRSVEDNRAGFDYVVFSYDLQFPGDLDVDGRPVTLPYRVRELYTPPRDIEMPRPLRLNPPTAEALDPLPQTTPLPPVTETRPERLEEERRQDLIRGHPAFDTRAQMEAYIAAHPEESFVGVTTSSGRFVARAVNEHELQRIANGVRGGLPLEELGWDAESRRSSWGVTGVYVNGRAIADGELANLYYSDDFLASIPGSSEPVRECEVYHLGEESFGRRPLTHEQALERWRALDAQTGITIHRLETLPGRRFRALWVTGPAGMHEIDVRYFRGRDAFRLHLNELDEDVDNLSASIGTGNEIDYFLAAELDRESEDPTFRSAISTRGTLARALGAFMYRRVGDRAQRLAIDTLLAGRDSLEPLATNLERMRQYVLGFADLAADRRDDSLRYIGVPGDLIEWVRGLLSDRATATQIALGVTQSRTRIEYETIHDPPGPHITVRHTFTDTLTIEMLMGWAGEVVTGLDSALSQLRSGAARALELEGELGNHVRELTYREMGFHALDPTRFPHGEETEGFLPGPLSPGRFHFGTLGEQLYANHAKHLADANFLWSILTIGLKVLAAVVLILIAQEVGLAIAGLLFAEGTAAFVATELIVSGLVFTALSEVESLALTGHTESESVGGFVGHTLLNIFMFGAFRALNVLLAAGARSFVTARVGGEAAFRASRGAQVAAEALRITGAGATFLAIGIAQRLASGQGIPEGRELFLFLYENLLTLALLEGGAVLARPLMERTSIWARERRLGALEGDVTTLRGDIVRLQRDLASLSVRPQSAQREAPALIERQRALLERQRTLVEQLRERFRTRSDAGELERQATSELELIDTALAGLREAEFLSVERVMPVEGSQSVFSYEASPEAAGRFRSYYGEDRVQVEADGTIRVTIPGLVGEMVFVPSTSLAAGTPPTVTRQQALYDRQQALLRRARLRGVTDPSLTAISRLRPLQQTSDATLDATETAIARAEAQAGARLETLTRNLLRNLRRRLGTESIAQIRSGELASVSDAELADVVWQARGLQNLDVPQFRALLFAARPGEPAIDFARLLTTMRRGRFLVADRNFALETFMMLAEARIPGARQILADMSQSPGHFTGGIYALEYMRYVEGIGRVARVELRVTVGDRDREYDVVLTDGTHIELKNWSGWEGRQVDSLLDEFDRDMRHLTNEFADPSGMRAMRYVFRNPPPISLRAIRAQLRTRLVDLLEERGAPTETRERMLDEFDDHARLVESPVIQRTGGIPMPNPALVTPLVPPGTDDDSSDTPAAPP